MDAMKVCMKLTSGRIFQRRYNGSVCVLPCLSSRLTCKHPFPVLENSSASYFSLLPSFLPSQGRLWFGFTKLLLRDLWVVEISGKNLRAVIYIVVLNMKWRRQRVIQFPSIEKNSNNILECVFFLVLPAELEQCNFIHATTHFVIHIEWIGWLNESTENMFRADWRKELNEVGG